MGLERRPPAGTRLAGPRNQTTLSPGQPTRYGNADPRAGALVAERRSVEVHPRVSPAELPASWIASAVAGNGPRPPCWRVREYTRLEPSARAVVMDRRHYHHQR